METQCNIALPVSGRVGWVLSGTVETDDHPSLQPDLPLFSRLHLDFHLFPRIENLYGSAGF